LIYLVCFSISCILLYFVQKYKTNRHLFIITCCIALLIPCLLAGLRAPIIGTDTSGYVKEVFEVAKFSNSFKSFYNAKWKNSYGVLQNINQYEIGFLFIEYFCAKIFGSFSVFLFMTELMIIVPIFWELLRFKNKVPLWLGMLTFYMLFYNTTLNAVRQWIAVAITFSGFHCLIKQKYIRYIFIIVISALFHNSAVISFAIMLLYIFFTHSFIERKYVKFNYNILNKFAIVVLAEICILVFLPLVASVLSKTFLYKYVYYLGFGTKRIYFLPNQILSRAFIFFLIFLDWKTYKKLDNIGVYISILATDMIIAQLASVNGYAVRIADFFKVYSVIIYPLIYNSQTHKTKKKIIELLIILFLLVYWTIYFAIKNFGETIPYLSIFSK